MAGISVRGTVDPLATCFGGMVGETVPGYSAFEYFSPLALVTEGFLFNAGNYWQDPDDIIQMVWLPCDCNAECD